jgi:hypothetical protein
MKVDVKKKENKEWAKIFERKSWEEMIVDIDTKPTSLFLPSSSPTVLTGLSGPHSRPATSQKIW